MGEIRIRITGGRRVAAAQESAPATVALVNFLPYSSTVTVPWIAFFAMLLVALVRRHGWEYVPVVIFLGIGQWYASDLAISDIADGVSLLSFAGVWVISGKTRT